jgi:hypothetical protein
MRSTSKKAQHGVKRHSSEESSSEETDNSKGSSSRKTSSHSQRRGKNLRKPNHPLSMERLRRGKR